MGLILRGLFVAGEPRVGKDGYYVSIAAGIDAYKVSVPDIPADLAFGDACTLKVRPNAFNGKIFYSGTFEEV